jgi:hypothetical protein
LTFQMCPVGDPQLGGRRHAEDWLSATCTSSHNT